MKTILTFIFLIMSVIPGFTATPQTSIQSLLQNAPVQNLPSSADHVVIINDGALKHIPFTQLGTIPAGGAIGQVLVKKTSGDFSTKWVDLNTQTGSFGSVINGGSSILDTSSSTIDGGNSSSNY